MPELFDTKEEKFAQLIVQGFNALESYVEVGYASHSGNASRFRNRPEIAVRIAELQRNGAEKASVSMAWFLKEAKALYEKCKNEAEYTAALKALELIGKSSGFFLADFSVATGSDSKIVVNVPHNSRDLIVEGQVTKKLTTEQDRERRNNGS